MTQPDPFSALLDTIAELKQVASTLHADLMRGDKATALLAELVAATSALLDRLCTHGELTSAHIDALDQAHAVACDFLAAAPAIPPGDGAA
jgi:hypothetical protein